MNACFDRGIGLLAPWQLHIDGSQALFKRSKVRDDMPLAFRKIVARVFNCFRHFLLSNLLSSLNDTVPLSSR